jgi:ubiquinone/menaquinone biosynthesis C-methylase UbiE
MKDVYVDKFARKLLQFNKSMPLPEYFAPLIGDKKEVVIAELGAGPINTIGNYWKSVKVTVIPSDKKVAEYQVQWEKYLARPLVPVVYQDMEALTYNNETFDIVHCRNSVDHTLNPLVAIQEMKRVCKKGGWVYLAHAPSQKTEYGGHHYHNFEELDLPEFNSHMENDLIISTWQKI